MTQRELVEKVLKPFFNRVREGVLVTRDLNGMMYDEGIRIKVGLGSGRMANIPFVGFLGGENTCQCGFYPALTYYRNYGVVFLTYAESVNVESIRGWGKLDHECIGEYFVRRGIALKKSEAKFSGERYYGVYGVDGMLSAEELERLAEDLSVVMGEYRNRLK